MLTQEQYETLLQELDQRPLAEEEPDQPAVAGLEEFLQIMRQALITGQRFLQKFGRTNGRIRLYYPQNRLWRCS